jgi:hypothetical protein
MEEKEMIKRSKSVLLDLLYDEAILKNMHKEILNGLVGSLDNEYISYFSIKPTTSITKLPMFKAVVDMFIANLIHHYAKDTIDEVLNILEKHFYILEKEKGEE